MATNSSDNELFKLESFLLTVQARQELILNYMFWYTAEIIFMLCLVYYEILKLIRNN